MTFNDTNQLQKCTSCPSVVLFYWIDMESSIAEHASSGFSNSFNSKFKKTSYDGVALRVYDDNEYEPVVPTYTYIISSSVDSEEKKQEYNFYYPRLLNNSSQEVKLKSPSFYYNLSQGETSLNFDIEQESDPSSPNYRKVYLIKEQGEPSEEKLELIRYNGDSFNIIPTLSQITSKEYNDYISVDSTYTEGAPLYVHFCVAFCASAGSFNNIFWSNLSIRNNLTFQIK